uniref:hypothetical protein n=1 Tax=Ensifer adhaerens TaxID=106592 RepID=UPI003F49216A
MEKRLGKFIKKMNWLLVAGVLTAAYLWGVRETIQPERLLAFVKEAKLNEVGDFLAGSFAPLAFIWLVAAVLTQRQELNDTRDQFAANQKITDAQLENVRQQTALVQKQNERAEKAAERNYRLNLFPERFEIFKAFDATCRRIEDAGWNYVNSGDLTALANQCQFVFSESVRDYVLNVAALRAKIDQIEDALGEARNPVGKFAEGGSMSRDEYTRTEKARDETIQQLRQQVRLTERMLHFADYLTVTDTKQFKA